MKITAIIPTFNEESSIQRALDSVAFADEVIVIDSFSTDKTVEIVKKNEAILIQRKFDDFSSQKNFAISKASNSWVLILDADEEIPKELKTEILQTVNAKTTFDAYYIYRSFFMKTTKLNFSGWQRDKVIRLFKKEKNKYLGKVHETIQTNGKIGFLKNKLNHYSYQSEQQYFSKLQMYAKLQAIELYERGENYSFIKQYFKPVIRFFIHFIVKLGFLDGVNGCKISYLHAQGVWLRYKELKKLINRS